MRKCSKTSYSKDKELNEMKSAAKDPKMDFNKGKNYRKEIY